MNILTTFQKFIYFQVDTNLLFLYTHLPTSTHLPLHYTNAQVRIGEGDNTAQYWPNLGSQESAIVIGPVSLFASVKCWADDCGFFRLFTITDLQPKLSPVLALYQADCNFYYVI